VPFKVIVEGWVMNDIDLNKSDGIEPDLNKPTLTMPSIGWGIGRRQRFVATFI
jgi:hypothetical protein